LIISVKGDKSSEYKTYPFAGAGFNINFTNSIGQPDFDANCTTNDECYTLLCSPNDNPLYQVKITPNKSNIDCNKLPSDNRVVKGYYNLYYDDLTGKTVFKTQTLGEASALLCDLSRNFDFTNSSSLLLYTHVTC
jgi:hypothetical protein